MNLLLIEDDVQLAAEIAAPLSAQGFEVTRITDGQAGLEAARARSFDLVITDRMLPRLEGLEIVRALRAGGDPVPILVLSALDTVDDRVLGLRAGSDDYLGKPFAIEELLARVESLLRRRQTAAETVLRVDDLEMDLIAHRATRAGREVTLTSREFRLLEFLVRHAGQVVTRSMLLEAVWDIRFDPQTNLIDVHVSRLRQAVDREFDKPLIHTVRGVGYTLRA
ncbi:MAG: response regulator transcription factor [Steroidobacteraceae bacterium]|jgi:two-component system OmpR family response regulator|nr:response regulator transcription factor [Steroidobacteraceae bacterium]